MRLTLGRRPFSSQPRRLRTLRPGAAPNTRGFSHHRASDTTATTHTTFCYAYVPDPRHQEQDAARDDRPPHPHPRPPHAVQAASLAELYPGLRVPAPTGDPAQPAPQQNSLRATRPAVPILSRRTTRDSYSPSLPFSFSSSLAPLPPPPLLPLLPPRPPRPPPSYPSHSPSHCSVCRPPRQ